MTKQRQESESDLLEKAIQQKDVKVLVDYFFNIELYPIQEDIVKTIVFQTENRLLLNTYSQFGKSFSIGVGLALHLILNGENLSNFEISIIGPAMNDAENVRDDLLEAGLESKEFKDMIDTSRGSDPEDLKKSASQSLITLNDGDIRIQCLSASSGSSGKGQGLMGSGADIVVMDESNRISESVWKKNIARMLNTEDAVLIEAGNPFHKDNQFYSHWISDDFKCFHVDDEKGIEIGRHSERFFDKKAKDVGGKNSLEYKVLYKSRFPDQVDNALIKHSWIKRAERRVNFIEASKNRDLDLDTDVKYSADIAGKGEDLIVVSRKESLKGEHLVTDQFSKKYSSDTGSTAEWIRNRIKEEPGKVDGVIVDSVGIGAGVYSKLKEYGYSVSEFRAGTNPSSEGDRFQNKKARNYFKLRDHLQDQTISFMDGWRNNDLDMPSNKLVHELTHIRTERRAKDKVRIVDPDSGSPDFSDSLMMSMFEPNTGFVI